jgi:putative transposase
MVKYPLRGGDTMPKQTATPITLSQKQERILTEFSNSKTLGTNLNNRSKIVLLAAAVMSNNEIERQLKFDANTIKRWRDRFAAKYEDLKRIENEEPHRLRASLKSVLSDNQRPGTPPTYTESQVAAILALACMNPMKFGLPFSHWTPSSLRDEAIVLGIVDDISIRQTGRYLNEKDLKPHRTKSWLNPDIKSFEEFQAQVQAICGIYLNIKELTARGVLVYSTDEKMGIQATEHTNPKKT